MLHLNRGKPVVQKMGAYGTIDLLNGIYIIKTVVKAEIITSSGCVPSPEGMGLETITVGVYIGLIFESEMINRLPSCSDKESQRKQRPSTHCEDRNTG